MDNVSNEKDLSLNLLRVSFIRWSSLRLVLALIALLAGRKINLRAVLLEKIDMQKRRGAVLPRG